MVSVEAIVEDERWSAALGDVQAFAERFVRAAAEREGAIAVLFADDAALRDLNRAHRGKDAPTNVLSFPADPRGGTLGDIALAYETIAREAAEQGKTAPDHAGHMLVHGTLHLLGYDHQAEAEAEIMEARERRVLAALGIADPYMIGGQIAGPAA